MGSIRLYRSQIWLKPKLFKATPWSIDWLQMFLVCLRLNQQLLWKLHLKLKQLILLPGPMLSFPTLHRSLGWAYCIRLHRASNTRPNAAWSVKLLLFGWLHKTLGSLRSKLSTGHFAGLKIRIWDHQVCYCWVQPSDSTVQSGQLGESGQKTGQISGCNLLQLCWAFCHSSWKFHGARKLQTIGTLHSPICCWGESKHKLLYSSIFYIGTVKNMTWLTWVEHGTHLTDSFNLSLIKRSWHPPNPDFDKVTVSMFQEEKVFSKYSMYIHTKKHMPILCICIPTIRGYSGRHPERPSPMFFGFWISDLYCRANTSLAILKAGWLITAKIVWCSGSNKIAFWFSWHSGESKNDFAFIATIASQTTPHIRYITKSM